MVVQFFMAMADVPTATHQEKKVSVKNGHPVLYEPQELKNARAKLTAHLSRHVPERPLSGPLELAVTWCFRRTPPRGAGMDWHKWRITPPDTDNLDKLLKDCMTKAGFWKDDALVCREIIEKFWASVPGIYIRVTEMEAGDAPGA